MSVWFCRLCFGVYGSCSSDQSHQRQRIAAPILSRTIAGAPSFFEILPEAHVVATPKSPVQPTMSTVEVLGVKVHNAEATFVDPFTFEITFEAYRDLPHDLEWKVIYVGSADSSSYDQVLDSVLVGPIKPGKNRFQFPAPAPDPKKIRNKDLLGVTIVLLTCSYKDQEFIRIGYYVSNKVAGMVSVHCPICFRLVEGCSSLIILCMLDNVGSPSWCGRAGNR